MLSHIDYIDYGVVTYRSDYFYLTTIQLKNIEKESVEISWDVRKPLPRYFKTV